MFVPFLKSWSWLRAGVCKAESSIKFFKDKTESLQQEMVWIETWQNEKCFVISGNLDICSSVQNAFSSFWPSPIPKTLTESQIDFEWFQSFVLVSDLGLVIVRPSQTGSHFSHLDPSSIFISSTAAPIENNQNSLILAETFAK